MKTIVVLLLARVVRKFSDNPYVAAGVVVIGVVIGAFVAVETISWLRDKRKNKDQFV